MKFTCEKDVLDQAFSIAGRAAATRSGSLQVLSGLHLELKKNNLSIIATAFVKRSQKIHVKLLGC